MQFGFGQIPQLPGAESLTVPIPPPMTDQIAAFTAGGTPVIASVVTSAGQPTPELRIERAGFITRHAKFVAGGALAAGLLVGWLIGRP